MTDGAGPIVRQFQTGLLAAVREYFANEGLSLSERIANATFAVPRHEFVRRYRYWGTDNWYDVDASNLEKHLPAIYRDDGLGIAGTDGDDQISTISRPSVVLHMLHMLDVRPGQRVFEVGTGSGWNAALLGKLVGAGGYVKTVEIIPALAARAESIIDRLGLGQVDVMSGDAAEALTDEAFDRVIFTAGSYDIPDNIFDLVRIGGLLLLVLKFAGGGDAVILFRRKADHFESITAKAYEFVPMTGRNRHEDLEPKPLQELGPWRELQDQVVSIRPFSHGGLGRAGFAARTHSVRTFLEASEPRMRWFVEPEGYPYYSFGLWDEPRRSLAIARDGQLTSYGTDVAALELLAAIHRWVDLGLPSAISMRVRAYRTGQAPPLRVDQFLMRRPRTDFVWSEREVNQPLSDG